MVAFVCDAGGHTAVAQAVVDGRQYAIGVPRRASRLLLVHSRDGNRRGRLRHIRFPAGLFHTKQCHP